jgi:guanine deaminase
VLAHAIHLSGREVARLVETGTRISHCPGSNLFLGAGLMPLGEWLAAGLVVGLGSDVSGGPEVSLFSVMRDGAHTQMARRALASGERSPLGPLDWLRLGTLEGARALGLDDAIGSLEAGKEADLIAVDPSVTAPLAGGDAGNPFDDARLLDDPADLVSRLIFRTHPDMVRGAWVRGRRLDAWRADP